LLKKLLRTVGRLLSIIAFGNTILEFDRIKKCIVIVASRFVGPDLKRRAGGNGGYYQIILSVTIFVIVIHARVCIFKYKESLVHAGDMLIEKTP
jgi:hypothetical protein